MGPNSNTGAATGAASMVLASGNAGKLAELGALLQPLQLTLRSLAEFTRESPEETGATFRENALLKARFAARIAHMPAIADDSGIEVDALDGAPGVYSARYAGPGATDASNNNKLLAALAGVADEKRSARFRCVLVYIRHADDPQPIFAEGVWEGAILHAPRGLAGFGYDPLFLPRGEMRSSAELTREEKNRVSHRAQALRALVERLRKLREIDSN